MTLPPNPLISVIIISYNMAREIPRTVQSFLPGYQLGVNDDEIEILVMENGSSHPVPAEIIASWPQNVRYIEVENPHHSPAKALNAGVEMARAPWVCPVIDGARMVTPGLFKNAKELFAIAKNPVIGTLGYHLGDKVQQQNIKFGYCQQAEDELLAGINWPNEPYRLFDISCLGGSARGAWFTPIAESNALILRKEFYQQMGGYDEAFDLPGGGVINLDFFKRAIDHADSRYFLLVGEGSFHQYHGGVTTSRAVGEPSIEDKTRTTWQIYAEQYEKLRGAPYQPSAQTPTIYGIMTPKVRNAAIAAALHIDAQLKLTD